MSLFRRKAVATGQMTCAACGQQGGRVHDCPQQTCDIHALARAMTATSRSVQSITWTLEHEQPELLHLWRVRQLVPPPEPLEVVCQDDLLQGTKFASLWMRDGKPEFRGAGNTVHPYGAEAYARCARGHAHEAPDRDCQCGFWIAEHRDSRLTSWTDSLVKLEVEFGGRVLDCGKDPLPAPAWGYRAQWQRVLSVSLPQQCGVRLCFGVCFGVCGGGPGRWLVTAGGSGRVVAACERHAAMLGSVPNPVAWLREGLQTEVRPGTVSDDAPPPSPSVQEELVYPADRVEQYVVRAGFEIAPGCKAAPGAQYVVNYGGQCEFRCIGNSDGTVTVVKRWTE